MAEFKLSELNGHVSILLISFWVGVIMVLVCSHFCGSVWALGSIVMLVWCCALCDY